MTQHHQTWIINESETKSDICFLFLCSFSIFFLSSPLSSSLHRSFHIFYSSPWQSDSTHLITNLFTYYNSLPSSYFVIYSPAISQWPPRDKEKVTLLCAVASASSHAKPIHMKGKKDTDKKNNNIHFHLRQQQQQRRRGICLTSGISSHTFNSGYLENMVHPAHITRVREREREKITAAAISKRTFENNDIRLFIVSIQTTKCT